MRRFSLALQTLAFSKSDYDRDSAVAWAKKHNRKSDSIKETEIDVYLKQLDPSLIKQGSNVCVDMGDGVTGIFGELRTDKAHLNRLVLKETSIWHQGITQEVEGHVHSFFFMTEIGPDGNLCCDIWGLTEATSEGKAHTHYIVSLSQTSIDEGHRHTFKMPFDIRQALEEVGEVDEANVSFIDSFEEGLKIISAFDQVNKARGDGQGQGGPTQGDGGVDKCVCPSCGYTKAHQKGTPCNEMSCPDCGAAMTGEAS